MTQDQDAKRVAFLLELRELTLKHGVAIGGCGCCGSPFLNFKASTDPQCGYATDRLAEELCWVAPGEYRWDELKDGRVLPPA